MFYIFIIIHLFKSQHIDFKFCKDNCSLEYADCVTGCNSLPNNRNCYKNCMDS